jgi:rhodanese-related sulfurtransferase
MKHSLKFIALAEDAKKSITETDVQSVKELLDGDVAFYLVDVREESEWVQGHIPGAIHLSKGIIERDIETRIPDVNSKIVLYCGGGYRSALTAVNLQKMGYKNVVSMDGGYRGWKEAGLKLETEELS